MRSFPSSKQLQVDRFDFDEIIDRQETPALKTHPRVLGGNAKMLFPASVADLDFKVAPVITEALMNRLQHGIFGYEAVPDKLLPSLINWLSSQHQWAVKTEHILRAPNVLNALAIAASLFTQPDESIIVQPPVFGDFYDVIHENHRQVVLNPLRLQSGRYEIDFDDLEKKAAAPKTTMLFLCNPHNPVGRVWRFDELKKLGDICIRHGLLIVSDEIHGDVTFKPHRYTPFASLGETYAKHSITCLSPAKTFNLASCCSAFTIIPDEQKRQLFQKENSRLTVNKNNAFANVAMIAAYESGKPWLEALLDYLSENVTQVRNYLKEIPQIKLIEPEGTFLLWLDCRELGFKTPQSLTAFMKQQAKWSVSRGEFFGEEGHGFIRLNIGCTKTRLKQALEQLKVAVLALPSMKEHEQTNLHEPTLKATQVQLSAPFSFFTPTSSNYSKEKKDTESSLTTADSTTTASSLHQ